MMHKLHALYANRDDSGSRMSHIWAVSEAVAMEEAQKACEKKERLLGIKECVEPVRPVEHLHD